MVGVWWLPAFYYLAKAAALAIPQNFDSESLPLELKSLLPSCGQPCVAASITSAWPSNVCGSTKNLSCLCTARSTTGFTLGEIAVGCLVSSCSAILDAGNEILLQTLYNICADQPGNHPNTHPTLTATAPQTASITGVSSILDISVPTRITSIPSSVDNNLPTSTPACVEPSRITSSACKISRSTAVFSSGTSSTSFRISSSSVVKTSSAVQPSATQSSTAPLPSTIQRTTISSTFSSNSNIGPTATSSTSSQPAPSQTSIPVSSSRRPLRGVEIAAIAVGSLVVVSILFSMVMIWLRQRRKGRQSRGDTSGFNILPSPSSVVGAGKIGLAEAGSIPHRSNGAAPGPETRTVADTPVKKVKLPSHLPDINPNEIGIAISPDSKPLPQTPRTGSGIPSRSNSRLLPDKPVYKPVPPVVLGSRPFSDATEFDEDVSSMYNSSRSDDTSVDWAAYYTDTFDPDEHLRGFQYARETGYLPTISRPIPAANPRGWDSSRPKPSKTRGSPLPTGHERRRASIVQGFPRPPRGIWPRQSETANNASHQPTHRPTKPNNESSKEDMSPISPSNLRYPPIPRSLSTTPFQAKAKPNPTRPSLPERNDTYARNEDLVIATTQALTKITGSSHLLVQQAERDARLRQLHLSDEVERARQGIEIMRQRAATAAARIHRAQGMGLASAPNLVDHRAAGLEGGVPRARPR